MFQNSKLKKYGEYEKLNYLPSHFHVVLFSDKNLKILQLFGKD